MRIRKDQTTYRASGILRRDARHQKPDDHHRPVAGRKNTKRWCRGHVGREHQPKCVSYREVKRSMVGFSSDFAKRWKLLICTVCGKELDYYYPWRENIEKYPPPPWVTD